MFSQKDYLEHLRTVHFALVLASLGLLIVASTHRPTLASRAHDELRQLLGLKGDLPIVQDYIRDILRHKNVKSDLHISSDANGLSLLILNKRVTFPTVFEAPEWLLVPDATGIYPIQFHSTPDMDSIAASKRLWQWMSHDFTLNIVTGLLQPGYIMNYDSPSKVNVYKVPYNLVHLENSATVKHFKDVEALPFRTASIASASPQYAALGDIKATYTVFFDYSDFNIQPLGDTANLLGYFPVRLELVDHVDLLSAWLAHHPQFHHGTFEENFPALSELGVGYESLEFSNLEKLIVQQEQLGAKPADDFEIFGLKFPAADALRWGGAILFSMQLYLLFTVKEANRVMGGESPDRETAWIGTYQSGFAYIIFTLSVTVLPMSGIASVGWQARAAGDPHHFNLAILFVAFVAEIAFSFILVRAMRRLRGKPQV